METEWAWSKPQEPSVTSVIKEHSLMCSRVATSPSHSSSHVYPPPAGRTRGGLPSAARSDHIHSRALGGVHAGVDLGACGVDPYGGVKVCFGGSQTHRQSVALGDLASIRAEQVEPYHTLL